MTPKVADIHKTLVFLCETYPQIFSFEKPRPLAIGIHTEIEKRHDENAIPRLQSAIAKYTGRMRYLEVLHRASHRVDLQGNPVGDITEKSREYAKNRILQLQVKYSVKNVNRAKAKEEQEVAKVRKAAKIAAERVRKKAARAAEKSKKRSNPPQSHRNQPVAEPAYPSVSATAKSTGPKIIVKKRRAIRLKPS